MKTTKKGAAFIAALTATDALSPTDHKREAADARLRRKSELYETRMLAEVAYHEAHAAAIYACLARVHDYPEREATNRREVLMVNRLIICIDAYLAVSFNGDTDRKERAANVRRWARCATTVDTGPAWKSARQRWHTHLTQEA